MLSTRVRTLPGRTAAHAGGQHCLVQLRWKGGHPCFGSRLTFDPKHAQLLSCLDSELASPWPQHLVGPKRLPCHVLYGAGHCLGCTQSYAGSWLHLLRPLGWMQASIPCLRRTRTRPSLWYRENRDSSLKIQCLHCLRSHTLCLLPHSRRRCLCSKVSLGHLAGHRDQYPATRSHLRMVRTDIRLPNRRIICIRRRGAEIKRFVLTIRSSWRSSRGVEIFIEPPRFLLMWSASLSVASQNFAYASIRHTQHSGYFPLRIAICRQPDNSLQYLLWQILCHVPFKSSKEISIVFTETPHCIKASKW